jgi:light-regulated signal transduction histidine kinase (bacteriophytochrome)
MPAPAFGTADLSNCELEQIQFADSIQPSGALLVVNEPQHVIIQSSANAAEFLGIPGPLLGRTLASLPGNLAVAVDRLLSRSLAGRPAAISCQIGSMPAPFDGLLHRPPGAGLVIELERAGPPLDLSADVATGLKTILSAASLGGLCDDAARIFRDVTGYDRVMIYRFDEQGHGQVVSEERRADLEALLGNRYPATDIPQMARRLYERNRVRVLVDVGYTPEPLSPVLSPLTGEHLDMSLCALRSVSPVHVQYLKNMGVGATLVASLMVGGRLWGLVSCHHYAPRLAHFEIRAVCELLAETLATRIAALESFAEGQAEIAVRRLEQRMIEAIAGNGDWRSALFDGSGAILRPLDANGAALLFEGEVLTAGDVPSTQQLRELSAWLDERPQMKLHATASLGLDVPRFAALTQIASGMIAAPVSTTPGEYLIWFRPEQVRTLTWGGDPFKAIVIGDNPKDLSPRRSFAQWHQLVEGTSEPWSGADLAAARLIGDTVTDVVLQFRAVRTLIAEDQLEQVRRQVRQSEQPLIIADGTGRIVLVNTAFMNLLPESGGNLLHINELASFCTDSAAVSQRLKDLVNDRRTWRGDIELITENELIRPVLVRADPVFSAPGRVLGFVLLFTDLTERRASDAARRRFQEDVVADHRLVSGLPDLVFQGLMATIVENAQLAALEITDGVDLSRMPEMLESVRASVARAADVLEVLVRHKGKGQAGSTSV